MSKKRYEYTFTEGNQPADLTPAMEQFGHTGWELVSVVFDTKETKYVAFLKKKVHLKKSHKDDESASRRVYAATNRSTFPLALPQKIVKQHP